MQKLLGMLVIHLFVTHPINLFRIFENQDEKARMIGTSSSTDQYQVVGAFIVDHWKL